MIVFITHLFAAYLATSLIVACITIFVDRICGTLIDPFDFWVRTTLTSCVLITMIELVRVI